MIRIVLHRLDGVAEITWADERALDAGEIHRCWETTGPSGSAVSMYENYSQRPRCSRGPTLHFDQTCLATVGVPSDVDQSEGESR